MLVHAASGSFQDLTYTAYLYGHAVNIIWLNRKCEQKTDINCISDFNGEIRLIFSPFQFLIWLDVPSNLKHPQFSFYLTVVVVSYLLTLNEQVVLFQNCKQTIVGLCVNIGLSTRDGFVISHSLTCKLVVVIHTHHSLIQLISRDTPPSWLHSHWHHLAIDFLLCLSMACINAAQLRDITKKLLWQ